MTATQIRQFHDLDLFVDMLAADKDHIDRAKAKAEAVKAARAKAEQARQRRIQNVGQRYSPPYCPVCDARYHRRNGGRAT